MPIRSRFTAALIIALVAVATGFAQAPSTSPPDTRASAEAAVLAAHDASIAAAEARDLERLFTCLLPNDRGAMVANGRIIATQEEVMAATRRDFSDLASIKYTYVHRHVTLLSPTSALMVADGRVSMTTHDGAAFAREFAHTIVFVRAGDDWKVVHLHASSPLATPGR